MKKKDILKHSPLEVFLNRNFSGESQLSIKIKYMDFSVNINEFILFKIILSPHLHSLDVFKYFLDKPGINLDAVDEKGNSFEDTFKLAM